MISEVGRPGGLPGRRNDIKRPFGYFGLMRTLLRPRRWRHLARISRVVRERPRFLWREVNRRVSTGRYHLRDAGGVVHVRHGTPDLGGLFEVFVLGNYEPPAPINELLKRIARSRTLRVADLGGNIGLFGLRVFRDFPSAEIVSYEPDPANAQVLKLTVDASGQRERWRLVTACAGACAGKVPFLAGAYLESQIVAEDDGRARLLAKIDAFADLASADWVKIDIEGGEWELLTDPRFAELAAAVLCLEYHPNRCPAESPRALAMAALQAAGYQVEPFEERAPGVGELWAWRPDST